MSAALHTAFILLAVYGLPELYRSPEPVEQPIVVELVMVAEVTTPAPPKIEPPKKEPEVARAEPQPEPPKPEPEPAKPPPPPPELPEPEPVKAPLPKPEPEMKVALAVPEPAPKPKPKPKPPPKSVVKVAKAVPKPKPKPRAPPKPRTENFNADQIAALLDKKLKKKPRERKARKERPRQKAEIRIPRRSASSRISTRALTMSEKDAIRFQFQQCWSVPTGAPDAENLSVRIRIFLNPDGSLRSPPVIVERARMNQPGQEFFRAAAESAWRAVKKCSPLKNLPVAKYNRWRDIELTFDPREMFRG